ncbi:MAG: DNA-processing protein DprA [Dehalococcoidia bacterium]
MENPELAQWLALRRAGLGSQNFSLLLSRFGTVATAWEAPIDEVGRAGLDAQFLRGFTKARATYEPERELALLREAGAKALTWLDAAYPASLREIPQSPPVIFVRGTAGPDFPRAVAVVGTRRVTPYGRQATETFCHALVDAGVAIISGLAHGVDAIAHRVAVERGGPTVAVLAGGIDKVYPKENVGLADRIREVGALVSEYPPGIPARPDYFPRRNRILSGLAQATLVIEAGAGSGALHTANWAFEQGRDVFAVPGSVFSKQSEGTNQLIRESTAKLVATPTQLCEELNLLHSGQQLPLESPAPIAPLERPPAVTSPIAGLSDEEARLVACLGGGSLHVDEVARELGSPVAAVSATLQILELRGKVRQVRPLVYASA